MLRSAFLLGVLLVSGAAQAQDAPSVERARGFYAAARFEEAVEAFDAIVADPDVSRASVAEAHRYLAALHIMLDQTDRATPHVEAVLAVDPAALPPDGAPPNVEEFFETARARVAPPPDEPADIPLENEASDGGNDDAIVFGLIGAGAALLIAGAIIVALVLTNESSNVARFEGVTIVGW